MSKKTELIRNTAIITLGKVATQLGSFLLLPLYTKVLSTAEYGIVDLVITYSSLLLPFITLAFEQALFRFLMDVRGDLEQSRQYISTTIDISSVLTALVFAVLIIISIVTSNSLFFYFGLVLVGSVISAVSLQIARGFGDNIGFTLGSSIAVVVQIICNILFLTVFHFGAAGMMLAIFVGNLMSGVYICFRCKLWRYVKIGHFDRKTFNELARYSLPLIPNQLSWWALNASDKVIVQSLIGVAGNGLIAVANKFSGAFTSFSGMFNISWAESVTIHIDDDDAQEFISSTIDTVYRLFLCACCGIISIMPFLFSAMIHEQYNEAAGLIPIFMLASLCNVVVSLYGVIYVAKKKTVEIAKTAVYAAVINIVTHLAFVKFIGIYAAAVSTLLGYGTMAVYRYFHSRRHIVIKFQKSTLLYSCLLIFVSLFSYYTGDLVIQFGALLIVCLATLVINKNFLIGIISMVRKNGTLRNK